jgi:hypothetical protein
MIARKYLTIKIVVASNVMFLGIYSGRFAGMRYYCANIVAFLATVSEC